MNSPSQRGPGRPKDEALAERRREEILAAATEVFAAKGIRGTDVQEIADRVGVGKGTVYRYFPTKDELFLATVRRVMDRLDERLQQLMGPQIGVVERTRLLIDTFLRFFEDHPAFVELLILERAEFRERGRLTFFEYEERLEQKWTAFHDEIAASGLFRYPPGQPQSIAFSELLYGTILTARFSGDRLDAEERRRILCDTILAGLLR